MLRRKNRRHRPSVERRKSPRTTLSLSLSFQVISAVDPETRTIFRKGTLRDIGMGGLCFYTSEIIVEGLHVSYEETPREKNKLLIKLMLPPPHGPIEVLAEAIWFERDFLDDRAAFKVGVRFIRFMEQGEEALRAFVKEHL
jgi:hypothetical protein